MIKAILFDLDDTLLSINLAAFMARYTADLSDMLARIGRVSSPRAAAALATAYLAMQNDARDDNLTNAEVFINAVKQRIDVDFEDAVVADALDFYDREVLPTRNSSIIHAVPREGAHEAIEQARDMGLIVALATNPAFSEGCLQTRLGWAHLTLDAFDLVSHIGNSHRLKPHARYFQEFVATLKLTPEECLMVGNDATRDFPRPDVGLKTAYVGHARPKRAVWRGDTAAFARELPALVDRLNTLGR